MSMPTAAAAPIARIARASARAVRRRILVALLALEIAVFARDRHELPDAGQRLRGAPAERRDRPAGRGADAGDRRAAASTCRSAR